MEILIGRNVPVDTLVTWHDARRPPSPAPFLCQGFSASAGPFRYTNKSVILPADSSEPQPQPSGPFFLLLLLPVRTFPLDGAYVAIPTVMTTGNFGSTGHVINVRRCVGEFSSSNAHYTSSYELGGTRGWGGRVVRTPAPENQDESCAEIKR